MEVSILQPSLQMHWQAGRQAGKQALELPHFSPLLFGPAAVPDNRDNAVHTCSSARSLLRWCQMATLQAPLGQAPLHAVQRRRQEPLLALVRASLPGAWRAAAGGAGGVGGGAREAVATVGRRAL